MSGATNASVSRGKQSFKEIKLQNERWELTILPEIGCHWTRLRLLAKGRWLDVLLPVPDYDALALHPTGYGSYLMAPWSNRIAKGVFELEGRTHHLRVNFKDGTAIHGDARTRPWSIVAHTAEKFEAALESRSFSDFNFPFPIKLRHSVELSGDRIRVELSIQNTGSERAPVGMGFHPFLKRRLTDADQDIILVVPASKVYPLESCLPTGPAQSVEGRTDLRKMAYLGAPGLDHCFTGLEHNEIRAIYPGSGIEVRFHVDPAMSHAVIYAPNDASGAPRDFVAVEPVTHVNDGFNCLAKGWSGTGVKVLSPGEPFGSGFEISFGDV